MIKKNNKKKVIEEINKKSVIDIFNIIDLIKKILKDKRKYECKIKIELLFLAGISVKLKQ